VQPILLYAVLRLTKLNKIGEIKMSSNHTYTCYYCKKKVEEFIKQSYGKVPEEVYEKLKNAKLIDDLLEHLPDDFVGGDTSRIGGCDLDYDYFESWGDGVYIDEKGNLHFSISGSCDLCGKEFHYEITLPENSSTKKIDLTKKEQVKND